MPLPEQTPREEFSERAGETAAGTLVMPHMVAVDDFRRNQAAARRRVEEAHQMQKRALGMEDIGKKKEGDTVASDDDMGDMIYTGDITLNPGQRVRLGKSTTIEADAEPVGDKPTNKPSQVDKSRPMWPTALLALSMLGGGAGVGYIVNDLLKPNPAPTAGVDTDTDTDTVMVLDFP